MLQGDLWLSVEATQYVDVTDGSPPSEKFYERLEKVTSRKILKSKNERAKRLLESAIQSWIEFDILPSPETLFILWDELSHELALEEMAFLYCSYNIQGDLLDNWFEQNTFFSFENYLDTLARSANTPSPLLREYKLYSSLGWQIGTSYDEYNDLVSANLAILMNREPIPALYCLITDKTDKWLEVLLLRQKDMKVYIHYTDSILPEERNFIMSQIGKPFYNEREE